MRSRRLWQSWAKIVARVDCKYKRSLLRPILDFKPIHPSFCLSFIAFDFLALFPNTPNFLADFPALSRPLKNFTQRENFSRKYLSKWSCYLLLVSGSSLVFLFICILLRLGFWKFNFGGICGIWAEFEGYCRSVLGNWCVLFVFCVCVSGVLVRVFFFFCEFGCKFGVLQVGICFLEVKFVVLFGVLQI